MSRYHHQNLTDGRLPLWRHGRLWWGRLHVEWSMFRRVGMWSATLRRRGFTAYAGWFGLHVQFSRHESAGAILFGVSAWDGLIEIEHPWVRENDWCRRDPWWRRSVRLRVCDWLLGPVRYESSKGEPFEVFVPMPEGSYRATATPKTAVWRRRFGIRKQHDEVWLDIPGGIPFSGKGENSWDCGDDGLWGIGGDTVEDAIANAVRSALRSRGRYGHDSKRTGEQPAIVLNPAKEAS